MSAAEITQDLAHIADGRYAEQRRRGEEFQAQYEADRPTKRGEVVHLAARRHRFFRRHAA